MFILNLFFNHNKPVQAPNISHFKEDEKECYEAIISYFLENSQTRVSHPVFSPSSSPTPESRTYWIIFRKAASWADLKAFFINAKSNSSHPEMIDEWLAFMQRIVLLNKGRSQTLSSEEMDLLSLTDLSLPERISCMQDRNYNNELHLEFRRGTEKLHLLTKDKELLKDRALKSCLCALVYNWQKLWAFLEWSEIPLNSRKLHVRVEIPSEEGIDLQKYVNGATKAIMTAKETCDSKDWPYSPNGEAVKIYFPKKIEVRETVYGPRTPPILTKPRSGSQLQLQEALHTFWPEEVDQDDWTLTVEAERIEEIATKALNKVNAELAEKKAFQ